MPPRTRKLFPTPDDAETAFYDAFERGDLAAMMVVWAEGDEVKACLDIAKGSLHKSFTTHNRQQRNKMIEMRLVEGPFERLEGYWRFDPLGDKACKV